ncbi:MAG TPA: potassium-transporting ATPase subunit KdpB [Polyangiaceae bacterium]
MSIQKKSVLDREILVPALGATFAKLDPRHMLKNPVMFVTEVGATVTTAEVFRATAHRESIAFVVQVALWLWFTVLFANFAEALAEGRGKAQADALRKTRTKTFANRELHAGGVEKVASDVLRKGDIVVVIAGELIPGDGEIIEGVASVDESVMTGESAPVIRESGGDRSAVTGGTTVLSDRIRIRISADPGESFLDRMIALIEGAKRKKTPNEIALNILLSALTIIFLLVCVGLRPFGAYIQSYTPGLSGSAFSTTVLIALLVCLIPTTIGGLLSAIGIAGIDRMVQKNVLAMSGKAVEAAGDVHVLLLDKTGTITIGNREAVGFFPAPGVDPKRLAEAAHLASLADETPEGKSIVALAAKEGRAGLPKASELTYAEFVEFSAQTRMSGVDVDGRAIRKGASDSIRDWVGKNFPIEVDRKVEEISKKGGTPLVVADGGEVLGTIYLKDIVKAGLPERFKEFRAMGIRTVMVTGDNPLTAAAIATEAGVDDFLAQAKPEDKLALIRKQQSLGYLVAMTGDGTNDAPALAQADVGVAMNSGTQAAKEAGNMVDLDSNPTKLIEIVEIGKQMLMTRGALTTFSVANDVAKYFAIIPAMLIGAFPQIRPLNVMGLGNPSSAILSAVIFNAVIIIFLIPLALRGVKFKALSAAEVLQRNLLVYGLGGLVVPFVGIKAIDLVVYNLLHLV